MREEGSHRYFLELSILCGGVWACVVCVCGGVGWGVWGCV